LSKIRLGVLAQQQGCDSRAADLVVPAIALDYHQGLVGVSLTPSAPGAKPAGGWTGPNGPETPAGGTEPKKPETWAEPDRVLG
jgi:hypothetical protein